MQKNFKQTIACITGTLCRFSRVAGLGKALVAILFIALLANPSHVLSAVVPSPSVTLAWNKSPSPEAIGYRIYYGAASGNYSNSVVVGDVTSNTISGLAIGTTYYLSVVAYNSFGLESTFSNEINFVVPGGLAQLQIRVAANKQAILTVVGIVGRMYEIQATPDLKTWTVLGSVTPGANGSVNYTNTNAGSFTKRYYRVRDIQP